MTAVAARIAGRVLAVAVGIGLAGTALGAELLYVSDPRCPPCQLFDQQIGPIYPKTDEAGRAPLRALQYGEPAPAAYAFIGQVRVAPTFVLVDQGREIGRFEGYSSDELFWMSLSVLMRGLDRVAGGH